MPMMAPLWKLLSMATLSVPAVAEVLHVQQPLEALPFRQLTSQHFEPSVGEFSDTSTLTVYYGPKNNVTVRHSNALFGIPLYGGSLTARVYLPQAPANSSGCADLTIDPQIPTTEPIIMLLDRGGCRFSQKVLNAQRAGAVGALVVDNMGLCGVSPECSADICSRCPLSTSNPQCQCVLPYMSGDGSSAGDVSIPSFMVPREAGNSMKPLAGPGPVGKAYATMSWDMPNPDDQVEYSVWLDANDEAAYRFRRGFEPYLPFIGTRAAFTPHFYIWDGRSAGCGTVWDCATQCINNGWYCNIDPDGDLYKGISGADVVTENLRQICIWNQAQATYASDYGMKWWNYADLFSARCTTPATWSQACSEAQMQAVGIDVSAVRACVLDSNSTVNVQTGDFTNKLLQEQINLRNEMAIAVLPSAVVNDIVLRGGTEPSNVVGAVCSGFSAGTAPPVCSCLDTPISGLQACADGLVPVQQGDSGIPGWAGGLISVVVIGVVAAIGASAYAHYRTKQDVQEMLDDYRGLMEGNDAADINSLEATTGSGAAGTGIAAGDRPRLIDNAASTASGFVGKIAAFLTPPPAGGIIAGLPYTSTSSSRPSSSMPAFGSAAAAAARPAGGYRDSATTSSRQAPAAAGSTGSGVI